MKIHMDLDCFFVSAERTLDSSLVGVPVAVGGRGDQNIFSSVHQKDKRLTMINSGAFVPLLFTSLNHQSKSFKEHFLDSDGRVRGIITASSYEAREFGIKTGTTIREALLLCPHIKILPPNHLLYHTISFNIAEHLRTKVPLVEQYSIDEFFGDLKGWVDDEEKAFEYCKEIKREILELFGVPISFGIYKDSKWIAKIATTLGKPNGETLIKKEELKRYLEDMPIEEFPGVGRAFTKRLKKYFVNTLGEARRKPHLFASLGWQGELLYKKICGEDREPVVPYKERKSIGMSRTFDPLYDRGELRRRVIILARHLSHTVLHLGLNPTTFYFSIKYEYHQKSKISLTEDRIFSEFFYLDLAKKVFEKIDIYKELKIIRIAISTNNFTSTNPKTLNLLEQEEDTKKRKLGESITKIRNKYGVDIVGVGV